MLYEVITKVLDRQKHVRDNERMNWTNLIQDLLDSGMTQMGIAEACKTGQSHISCLYRGERKCPNYDLGVSLVSLHKRKIRRRKVSAS